MRAFGFAARGMAHRRPAPREAAPVLGALTLSQASLAEGSGPGSPVGTVRGRTPGAALALVDAAGGRLSLVGGSLVAGTVATDFESAAQHSVTLRETLAGATNSPRDTVLTVTVTNVFERPDLAALSLAGAAALRSGTAASGAIAGATAGSTIAATGLPAGLAIDGAARTWSWSGAGAAGTSTITLTETLADSANSPRASAIAVTVAAAPPPRFGAAGLTWGDPSLTFGKAA